MILDLVSYQNQLEAHRLTRGAVPHPAFQLMQAPNGLPMTTPWTVCAIGQPVQQQPRNGLFDFRPQPRNRSLFGK